MRFYLKIKFFGMSCLKIGIFFLTKTRFFIHFNKRDKKDKKFDKFFQMLMHFFINNSTLPQLKTGSVESPKIITKPSKSIIKINFLLKILYTKADIEEESKSPPYEPKNIIDSLPDFHRTQSSPPPPPPPSLLPFSKEKIEVQAIYCL